MLRSIVSTSLTLNERSTVNSLFEFYGKSLGMHLITKAIMQDFIESFAYVERKKHRRFI